MSRRDSISTLVNDSRKVTLSFWHLACMILCQQLCNNCHSGNVLGFFRCVKSDASPFHSIWEMNHRIIESWVGKDLWNHQVQPSTQHHHSYKTISRSTTSTHFLNTSRDGDSTTFLGSLFQCLTTLSVKKFFLISNLNLPWCNLRPLPLILSLVTWEKRPTLTSLQPPFS